MPDGSQPFPSLIALIQNLNRVHTGIVRLRNERENQLSLRIRLYPGKPLLHCLERPPRFLENIEGLQQGHSVTKHIENTAAHAASIGALRAVPCFGKVQDHRILARSHRDGVVEISISLAL